MTPRIPHGACACTHPRQPVCNTPYGHGCALGQHVLPHCTGPCHQGRRPCPCPTSCGLAADDHEGDPHGVSGALAWPIGLLAVLLLLVAAVSLWPAR